MCRRSPLIPSAKRARTPAGNTADSSGGNSVMSAPPECFLACNYRLFTGERRFGHAPPQPLSTALSVTAAPPQHTAAGSATFCNDRAALERVLVLRVRPSAPDGNGNGTPRLVERTRNISHAEKAWLGARANRATYRVATRCTRSV